MFSKLSAEWLSANLSKAYPLDDTTGGVPGTLPSSLLTDAFILVSGLSEEVSIKSAYISKIRNTGKSILLSVDIVTNDSTYSFSDSVDISFDSEDLHTEEFSGTVDGVSVVMALTAGLISTAKNMPAVTDLTEQQGKLFSVLVRKLPRSLVGLNSISINGVTLTGDVSIELSDGIEVEKLDDSSVKLTLTNFDTPLENSQIVSDDDILSTLISRYGTPIRTINGATPNDEGAFLILSGADVEGEDRYKYAHVEASGSGDAGVIRLKLALDPCLELDDIRTLTENLEELNDRAARLDSAQISLDNAIGSVATQLTRLG